MVIDIIQKKILFAKGFKDLLGYHDNEMDIEIIVGGRHPNDDKIVSKIGQATITYAMDNPLDSASYSLLMTFRRRKRDGSYIKILSSTTTYETDATGRMKSLLISYTDVSFMDDSESIYWKFDMDNLNNIEFRKKIYLSYKDFFSTREIDIIKCIKKDFKNKEIAKVLFISPHTVKTHRKKIFKKAKCHNKKELLFFCSKKGII